jgi:ABC-type lipoprotein export system ATPase subunit
MSKTEGVTVVVVTHDPVVAEMTDRILLMRDGMIVGEKRMA